jgi:hypothetical protein
MEFGGSISQRILRESKGRVHAIKKKKGSLGPSVELERLDWLLVRVNARDSHW